MNGQNPEKAKPDTLRVLHVLKKQYQQSPEKTPDGPAAEFLGTFTDEIKSIPTNSSKKIQKHFPDHLMR